MRKKPTKEQNREYQRRWHAKNPGAKARFNREWIKNNRDRYNAAKWRYRDKVRLETLTHYSDGPPKCAHCSFDNMDALCLDHIENNGAEHRRSISKSRGSGVNVYEVLRKEGYPEGFQVLCHNCNWIKEMKRRREEYRSNNPFYDPS